MTTEVCKDPNLSIKRMIYIYGSIISLNEQEHSEILKVLVAADDQELVDYLQKYFIENKTE
ncbi:hypothetical protein C1645_837379 [Glomus cerebriforme]|uniref:Uncharacterized protein n=1 Tax=Glomus cerebriforme TaxID=658196 RepID=A0A397SB12_9GLOM|nr:hypothetical protein C1645_837379 [Glomus cerebriforme]